MSNEQMRTEFEVIAKKLGLSLESEGDDYYWMDTRQGYALWQAARQPAGQEPRRYDQSAEDRFEQFVQAEIASSPNALRELGEYLGRVLDEDEFPAANRLLLQLATEYTAAPAAAAAVPVDGDQNAAIVEAAKLAYGLLWMGTNLSGPEFAGRARVALRDALGKPRCGEGITAARASLATHPQPAAAKDGDA